MNIKLWALISEPKHNERLAIARKYERNEVLVCRNDFSMWRN